MSTQDIVGALHRAGLRRASTLESMARHTSWRIGGPADFFCVVEERQQLAEAVRIAKSAGIPWLVLGGGNNILVSDQGVEGLVILNRLRGMEIDEGPVLECGAGVFFAKAAQFSARRGFTGMEWGISIPGTVGAGVVNNAGAHWSDVSKALVSAEVMDDAGNTQRFSPSQLVYQYRQSVLKRSHLVQSYLVVTSCRFGLVPEKVEAAQARLEEFRRHRQETQPISEPSAGSTFKNPPGDHAGALIDRAGLKGRRQGEAEIAPLHGNFILNRGAARAVDVLELIRTAQSEVHRQFDVWLEPEVQFVGRWNKDEIDTVFGNGA